MVYLKLYQPLRLRSRPGATLVECHARTPYTSHSTSSSGAQRKDRIAHHTVAPDRSLRNGWPLLLAGLDSAYRLVRTPFVQLSVALCLRTRASVKWRARLLT